MTIDPFQGVDEIWPSDVDIIFVRVTTQEPNPNPDPNPNPNPNPNTKLTLALKHMYTLTLLCTVHRGSGDSHLVINLGEGSTHARDAPKSHSGQVRVTLVWLDQPMNTLCL